MLTTSLCSVLGTLIALSCGVRPAAAAMASAAGVIVCGATRPRGVWPKVDWSLLLLFGGLFVLTCGLESAGIAHRVVETIAGPLEQAGDLGLLRFGTSVAALSQLVSNVPATILFVPALQSIAPDTARSFWLALAAYSTLAGNFTILGSAANVIVLESAPREGIDIGFFEYAKVGAPVTVVTLAAARLWLR